jgi:hypothetical protein
MHTCCRVLFESVSVGLYTTVLSKPSLAEMCGRGSGGGGLAARFEDLQPLLLLFLQRLQRIAVARVEQVSNLTTLIVVVGIRLLFLQRLQRIAVARVEQVSSLYRKNSYSCWYLVVVPATSAAHCSGTRRAGQQFV